MLLRETAVLVKMHVGEQPSATSMQETRSSVHVPPSTPSTSARASGSTWQATSMFLRELNASAGLRESILLGTAPKVCHQQRRVRNAWLMRSVGQATLRFSRSASAGIQRRGWSSVIFMERIPNGLKQNSLYLSTNLTFLYPYRHFSSMTTMQAHVTAMSVPAGPNAMKKASGRNGNAPSSRHSITLSLSTTLSA